MYKNQGVKVYNMRAPGKFKSEAGEGWCYILYHCITVTLSAKFTFSKPVHGSLWINTIAEGKEKGPAFWFVILKNDEGNQNGERVHFK